MERKTYLQPQITMIEVCAERGFAGSAVEGEVEGFDREEWNE